MLSVGGTFSAMVLDGGIVGRERCVIVARSRFLFGRVRVRYAWQDKVKFLSGPFLPLPLLPLKLDCLEQFGIDAIRHVVALNHRLLR